MLPKRQKQFDTYRYQPGRKSAEVSNAALTKEHREICVGTRLLPVFIYHWFHMQLFFKEHITGIQPLITFFFSHKVLQQTKCKSQEFFICAHLCHFEYATNVLYKIEWVKSRLNYKRVLPEKASISTSHNGEGVKWWHVWKASEIMVNVWELQLTKA